MTQTKTQELLERLEQGVKATFESENYKEWLSVLSKFHNYSYSNTFLIFMQNAEATQVAGYRTWESLGRNVKKGEKAIQILAPATRKEVDEKTGEEHRVLSGFFYVNVFDISQTEGEDLPEIAQKLTTDSKKDYLTKLEAIAKTEGLSVEYTDDMRGNGSYSNMAKRIRIKNGLAPDHQFKTFVHELAHHYTHSSLDEYSVGEVVAESVAYVVSAHLGLDTSDFSFGYVAGWSHTQDTTVLKKVAGVIQKTANKLIQALA